jgi:hypothetical protein
MDKNAQGMRRLRVLGLLFTVAGSVGCCVAAVAIALVNYRGKVVLYALIFGCAFWAMTLIGLVLLGLHHIIETRRRRSRGADGISDGSAEAKRGPRGCSNEVGP